MKPTVAELARRLDAQAVGDTSFIPTELSALDETDPASISPVFTTRLLDGAPRLPGAVLSDEKIAGYALARGVRAALVHERPKQVLAALINIFYPEIPPDPGIHPTAFVHPAATLPKEISVGPGAVIEAGVTMGEGCIIGAGAILLSGCTLGNRVRIGPGAVIGHEGFGFVPTKDGPLKLRQVGRVVIEDDVEIGANACVDRGTLGTTRIGRGAKLDNLVQIGHNARIGQFALLAGQVGIAGSAVIEDRAMIGGQAGVADHLVVGRDAKVAAKSGVTADVPPGTVVAGYPAMPRVRWLRFFAEADNRKNNASNSKRGGRKTP